MSNNDSFDPDRKDSKKAPIADPASPPDPTVRKAAEQTGAKGSAATPASPVGLGGHTGTSRTSNVSGRPGSSGVTGTTGNPASTSTPASRVTPTDAGAPGEAQDVAGVPVNESPAAAGSAGTAGTDRKTDAAGPSSPGGSASTGQSQNVRDEIKATGEKLKEEAREATRNAAERARTQSEEHQVGETLRNLPQKVEGRPDNSMSGKMMRFTQDHPRMVAAAGAVAAATGFLLARAMRGSKRKSGGTGNPGANPGYRNQDLDRDFTQASEQGNQTAPPAAKPGSSIGTGYDQGGRSRI